MGLPSGVDGDGHVATTDATWAEVGRVKGRRAGAVELAERDPGLCRILTSARYVAALSQSLLSACGGSAALERRIVSFWQERHHRVVREGPRKTREVDVRAACESLELGRASDARLLVDAGLAGNSAPLGFNLSLSPGISARPVELLEALAEWTLRLRGKKPFFAADEHGE